MKMGKRPLILLMLAAMIALAGCSAPTDDEQQIRDHLDTMSQALEEDHVRDFMRPIAEDFVAGNGGLNRNAVMLLVRRERLARQEVNIQRLNTDVEILTADRATANFQAIATGGTGLIPDEGQLWNVETGWRKQGDDWQMISASWERAL
ncbi:MAG: hypothetical protein AAGH65_05925 [Pseudomonadota bacterium]